MAKPFNPERLTALDQRRVELRAELEEVIKALDTEIAKAVADGWRQADIMRVTTLTREAIAQKMRPSGNRWKRGKTKDAE
jgi:hypothetical protein